MEFNYSVHNHITFGVGAVQKLPELVGQYKAKALMVIYDKGVDDAGIAKKVKEQLEEKNIAYTVYDQVQPNPTDISVEEAAQQAIAYGADLFVAVGGGSSMDLAKAVNVLMTNPSPIGQYGGMGKVVHPVKPLIAIPTTAGTSSEITNVAALMDTTAIVKYVIIDDKITPSDILVDPAFTLSVPPSVTAATGMDAITHAVESYISVMASPLTEYASLEALKIFHEYLPKVVADGKNLEAREQMMIACIIVGSAFSNANLGLVHAIAHTLSAHFHLPHGMANAAVLPYVMEYNAKSCPNKMMTMGAAIGLEMTGNPHDDAYLFAQELKKMIHALDIRKLSEQGIKETDFEMLAGDVLKEPVLNFNPRQQVTKEDVIEILRKAF